MSSKFQPGDEMFDETEGHKMNRTVVADESDETEGHRVILVADEDDEVEGHRIIGSPSQAERRDVADEDDDVEGHRVI